MHLVEGGAIPEWKVDEAIHIWQATRRELKTSVNPASAERLLFLTMLLAQRFFGQGDQKRERALFESALNALSLPRHRQLMRGYLTRAAARQGDLAAAEAWLAPCDRQSDDLQMDSAYRYSRAYIDLLKGDWNAVGQGLGWNESDVPILDAMESMCVVMRAHALEMLGRIELATEQLTKLLGSGGRRQVEGIMKSYAHWNLCPQSLPTAQAKFAVAAGAASGARGGGGAGTMLMGVGGLMGVIGIGMLVGSFFMPMGASGLLVPGIIMPCVGLFMGRLGLGLRRSAAKAARIRVHGIAATGQIVSATPTGMSINDVPQMNVEMQVLIEGKAPYPASTKLLVPPQMLAQLVPGVQVQIRVDPEDPSALVIETN